MTDEIVAPIPLLRCTQCQQDFPATTEYFSHAKGKLKPWCKPCAAKWQRDNRTKNGDKVRQYDRDRRLANIEEERRKDREYEARRAEERHVQKKALYHANPEPRRLRQREYYWKHTEERREYNQKYAQEHAPELRERSRRYDQEHPEVGKRYRKTHRIEDRTRQHKRRMQKLERGGYFTVSDIKLQQKAQTDKKGRLRCWWCSKIIKNDNFHIDHRVPLSKGGSNLPENLCISCPSCNLRKSNKLPQEFNGRLL